MELWICELPYGSYVIPDIQNYFDYTIKKHDILADNPPIQTCINKIENRSTFKINNKDTVLSCKYLNWINYVEALEKW